MSLNAGNLSGGLTLDTSKFTTPLREAVSEATSGSNTLKNALGKPFAPAAGEADKLSTSIGHLNYEVAGVSKSMLQAENDGRSLSRTFASLASTAAGTAIGGVITAGIGTAISAATSLVGTLGSVALEGVKLSAQAESTALALTTMIGDSGKAQALLRDLRTFANSTPFEFPELANAAKQLLAMGINSTEVVRTLRVLGDVSSGLGQPVGEMAYLFGQIRSQGRAMTQDLNQFAGRGVPIYAELARVLKTNELGVRELAETGQISFDKINAAFESMTSEGGKFFNMTSSQAGTTAGLFSTLQDAIGDVEKQIGDALIQGTDGKTLLRDITTGIDKLKPAAVEAAVALASAFKSVLPAIKAAGNYLSVVLEKLGLIDQNKANGNPYNGNAADKQDVARNAANSPEAFNQLDAVQRGADKAIAGVAETFKGRSKETADGEYGFELERLATALRENMRQSTAAMAAVREKQASGQPLSDEDFQKAKDEAAYSLKALGKLQDFLNQMAGKVDAGGKDAGLIGESLSKIRAAQNDSQKALADLTNAAAARNAAAASAASTKQAGEWAEAPAMTPAAAAGSPAASPASPGAAGAGGTPPAGRGGYDVAKAVADARVAALEMTGKREEAELLKIRQRRDGQFASVNEQANAGNLSVKDSVDASRAITTEYEAAAKQIRDRFAQERAREAEQKDRESLASANTLAGAMARVDEYRTQAVVASLKTQGRARDAEIMAFDSAWKKRIDGATTQEERYTAVVAYEAERREKLREAEQRGDANRAATVPELQQRVREAKPGSGQRELARIDLKEATGKTLTNDELTRRQRLQNRFGITPTPGRSERELPRSPIPATPVDAIAATEAAIRTRLSALMPPGGPGGRPAASPGRRFADSSPLAPPRMPNFPWLAALSPALQPYRAGPSASSQPATVNVTPNVNVDSKKLATACIEAVIPIIDRRIDRLRGELQDANRNSYIAARL